MPIIDFSLVNFEDFNFTVDPHRFNNIEDEEERFVVRMNLNGLDLGYAYLDLNKKSQVAYLAWFQINESYRNEKLAKFLLQKVESIIRNWGVIGELRNGIIEPGKQDFFARKGWGITNEKERRMVKTFN